LKKDGAPKYEGPKYGAGIMPDYLDPNAPDFLEDPSPPVKEIGSSHLQPPQVKPATNEPVHDNIDDFGL